MGEKRMTELDNRLREIALVNWNQFVGLIGEDAVLKAKICMLRKQKQSYGQISKKLGVTERQAQYGCQRCED